jgi:hypothetical protein
MYSRRDRVDTLALDALPSLLLDLLGDSLQVLSRGLESPVRLDGLFDFSVGTCTARQHENLLSQHFYVPIRGKPKTADVTPDILEEEVIKHVKCMSQR